MIVGGCRQHKNTKQMQSLPLKRNFTSTLKKYGKKNSTVENPVTGARGLGAHLILTKTKLPSHWIEGEPRADVYLRFTTLVVLGFWMCLLVSSTKQNAEKPKSETTHRFRVCGVGWGEDPSPDLHTRIAREPPRTATRL